MFSQESKDTNNYYKRLWEDTQEQQRQRDELAWEKSMRREREREKEYEHIRDFEADTWPEAFRKNIRRLKAERDEWIAFAKDNPDHGAVRVYLEHRRNRTDLVIIQIAVNKAANDILAQEESFIAPIVKRLQAFIDTLHRRARQRTLKRLYERFGEDTAELLDCIVDGEPSDLLDW